jgi:hypothetical protein
MPIAVWCDNPRTELTPLSSLLCTYVPQSKILCITSV